MKKDYQLYHQSHFENKTDVINRLVERIGSLEKEVSRLREENRLLKQKYISSLKNGIKDKANPFLISFHMRGDVNGFELGQKKKKSVASSGNNNNGSQSTKINQSQANISMYLTTDINDNNTNDNGIGNMINKQMTNTNTTSKKKKKKVLSLSQSNLNLAPEMIEPKIEASSYLPTESEGNNSKNYHKDNYIRNKLIISFRPNSTQKGFIIKDNIISNDNPNQGQVVVSVNKDTKQNQQDCLKTRNDINGNYIIEKYQSNNSNSNGNTTTNINSSTNNNNSSSLSYIYNKQIISSERKYVKRELKEKENQLIQIHKKLFSKSPLTTKTKN